MKLTKLLAFFSTRHREPGVCEACGGPFTCGAKLTGCWCSEIKLSDEMRTDLKGRYRSCLCRQCLEKFAAIESEHDVPGGSPFLSPSPQRGGEEKLNQIPPASPVDNAG